MNLDFIPLWAFFFGTIAIILASIEAGFKLGLKAHKGSPDEKESPAAAMGGAVLGLLAFILAFTFSISTGRYDARKQLVREEANAIRTAYLRASFLPEMEQEDVKRLLRSYLDQRIEFAKTGSMSELPEVEVRTRRIQQQLWNSAVANGRKDLNSDIGALLVESINEIIDMHALRITVAAQTRIPAAIWLVLFTISIFGMLAMGYQTGIAGSRRTKASIILAVSFALVIWLIAGLDRPDTPFSRVPQQPLMDVQQFIDHMQPN